jgi:hypothetical protein
MAQVSVDLEDTTSSSAKGLSYRLSQKTQLAVVLDDPVISTPRGQN